MFINLLRASIPYLAVGLGLFVFHNAWIAILAYHAGMAAVLLLGKPALRFKQIFRTTAHKRSVLPAVIGAGGGALLYLLWPMLSVPRDISAYIQSIGLTAAAWPYFLAYYILVNPALEELFWRGYLGNSAKRPVLNDFLFAGYHLIVLAGNISLVWLAIAFLVLCGAGWYWRQVSRITEGLLAAILSHGAADITVIFSIYLLTSTGS